MSNNKNISNSNPEIPVQNGATHQEPVLVGSANQIVRLISLVMFCTILVLSYFGLENLKLLKDTEAKIGRLEIQVQTLEDIVVNKTLAVRG